MALLVILGRQAGADIIPILPSDFSASAMVIDFETGNTGLPTVPGVTFDETFSLATPWFDGTSSFSNFPGSEFGDQLWANVTSLTYSDLALEFDTPVEAVGAWVGRVNSVIDVDEVVVELFDELGMSLGADAIVIPASDPFNVPVFFGYSASAPIARLEIRGNDMGFFGADNVTYGSVSAVPEPSSLALCAFAALTSMGFGRRFRPKAK